MIPIKQFKFWSRAVDFDFLVNEGVIAPEDKDLFICVEKAEEAWKIIRSFYYENNVAGDS